MRSQHYPFTVIFSFDKTVLAGHHVKVGFGMVLVSSSLGPLLCAAGALSGGERADRRFNPTLNIVQKPRLRGIMSNIATIGDLGGPCWKMRKPFC